MKKWFIISITSTILIFQTCCMDCVRPSQNVITETRTVPEFTGIKLRGSGNVVLHKGVPKPLTIRCNENLIQYLETDVVGHTLVINFDRCITGKTTLEIDATLSELELLEISGSGKIIATENYSGNKIDVNISGSGDVIAKIDAAELNSRISGSGTISLTGRVKEHSVQISGSGDLFGFDLLSNDAEAHISGSGTCELNASNTLEVFISGSGDVIYKGAPDVRTSISGSGKARALPN